MSDFRVFGLADYRVLEICIVKFSIDLIGQGGGGKGRGQRENVCMIAGGVSRRRMKPAEILVFLFSISCFPAADREALGVQGRF